VRIFKFSNVRYSLFGRNLSTRVLQFSVNKNTTLKLFIWVRSNIALAPSHQYQIGSDSCDFGLKLTITSFPTGLLRANKNVPLLGRITTYVTRLCNSEFTPREIRIAIFYVYITTIVRSYPSRMNLGC